MSAKVLAGIVTSLVIGGITLIASVDKVYALWAGGALLVIAVIITVIWWITWKRRKNKVALGLENRLSSLQQREVDAANTELEKMENAVVAMIGKAGRSDVTAATGITQGSSITVGATAYALSDYLSSVIKGTYSIDANGVLTGISYPGRISWDATNKRWKKT